MAVKVLWSINEVAQHLDVSAREVRDLVAAGYLHPDDIEALRFDAAAVKEWRRTLEDDGEGGGDYVREVLRDSATMDHAARQTEAPPR
jgi:hypothetical protein